MSQVSVSPSPRHSSYHHQLPANSSPTSTISDDDDLSNHSDSPNDLRTAQKSSRHHSSGGFGNGTGSGYHSFYSPPQSHHNSGSNSSHSQQPQYVATNECRLIEYRGHRIAAFLAANRQGEYLLCLPQAFELFLKHLVGGLHTVYTKLKRLDIVPIVCNVEQVRILRGLGAIQPGVNRCKLLSANDFDVLYKDCTTAR
ncbi:Dachshund 1 [Dermatophagoides farinae]|nr:Dachshund 1 [Dermatophagoides farinae]